MQFTQPDPPAGAGDQTGPGGSDGPAEPARARRALRRRGLAAGAVVAGLAGLTTGVVLASSSGQDQPASLAALSSRGHRAASGRLRPGRPPAPHRAQQRR